MQVRCNGCRCKRIPASGRPSRYSAGTDERVIQGSVRYPMSHELLHVGWTASAKDAIKLSKFLTALEYS